MGNEPKPVMTVPKEKAVFRLDRHGNWHTDEGKFTNRNIIRYFHSMIKKDEGGYFLEQEREQVIEKVYFSYEDTALFVFQVIDRDGVVLRLNTGERVKLDPEKLFVNDKVHLSPDGHKVFAETVLSAIANGGKPAK